MITYTPPNIFDENLFQARTSRWVEVGRRNGTHHKNLMENMTRANDFIIILGTTLSLAGLKLVTRDRNQRTRIKERLSGSKNIPPPPRIPDVYSVYNIIQCSAEKDFLGFFFC